MDKVAVGEASAVDTGIGKVPGAVAGRGGTETTSARPDITIRLPHDGDWAALRALVRQHHGHTAFSDIPFSDRKLALLERQARNPEPHECLIVAERGGRVAGLAWFSAGSICWAKEPR